MIKKTILTLQLVLISLYSYGQECIELPLIGDRLSEAVSQTEEEALGRQFLRDLKRESQFSMIPLFKNGPNYLFIKLVSKAKLVKKHLNY